MIQKLYYSDPPLRKKFLVRNGGVHTMSIIGNGGKLLGRLEPLQGAIVKTNRKGKFTHFEKVNDNGRDEAL